jgi:hypothetical protein
LVETGQVDFDGDGDLMVAETPGWVVVASHDYEFAKGRVDSLVALGEVVTGQCWDVIMHSAARGFVGGQEVWSVSHDPEAEADLNVTGAPPAGLAAIRDRLTLQQAEHADEPVDFMYDAPTQLAASLCGYNPQDGVAAGTVFLVVEPSRSGKAGEQQATERRVLDSLGAGVASEILPLALEMGFEPAVAQPDFHKFYPFGAAHVVVRRRGEWSDALELRWGRRNGWPRVAIDIFVRQGSDPRYGRAGHAIVPTPRPSLMERFTGRKSDPAAEVAAAIVDGGDLLSSVDRHLRDGTPHPHLRPAEYRDQEP